MASCDSSMETIEKLSNQGWHITAEGLNLIVSDIGKSDLKDIIENALDSDLKDFGKSVLSSELNKEKIQQLVLQIQKIKNIAAPKSNEDSQVAPRMLKLILTDGFTYCQGIEIENIPFLSLSKTAPGMKLLIKGASVASGYILLQQNTCNLLGGKVSALYEKWEVSKTIMKHTRRSFDGDGPPPWVNFGQKILSSLDSRSFKSLDNKVKDQTKQNGNSNFDTQRQDAIAEATSGAIKKVFGGGIKQSIQLKENKKADYNNKRYNQEKDRDRNNGRKIKRDITDDEKPQKPSDKVSLFDFLEEKLTSSDTSNNVKKNLPSNAVANDGAKNDISQGKAPKFNNQNASNYYANSRNYRQTPKSGNSMWYNQNGPQNNSQNIQSNNMSENFMQNKPQNSNNMQQSENKTPNTTVLTNSMERLSVNSQFASRSLKQHLNLASKTNAQKTSTNLSSVKNNNADSSSTWKWKVGDLCMAKYWEDNKHYNATVIDTTNRTCVVQFNGYGNYEEVLHIDCIPIMNDGQIYVNVDKDLTRNTESRRGGSKYYVNNKNFYKARNDK